MIGRVNVLDFGADPLGLADSTQAFKDARDALQGDFDQRGGTLYVPAGMYRLSDELAFSPYVAGQVFNITVSGDGPEVTVLDFQSCAAGKHGISATGQGTGFFVENLSIKRAPGHGVRLRGGPVGGTSFMHRCGLRNVRIQQCGLGGFYTENSFFVDVINSWALLNSGPGFHFAGFHTTVNASGSWALQNTSSPGWRLNGIYGGQFTNCYGEFCQVGWSLTNTQAVDFVGCGGENCSREGFELRSGSAFIAPGLPAECHDININMRACKALQNSRSGANAWANFLSALAANGRRIQITFGGGNVSALGSSTTVDLALNGTGGPVDLFGWYATGKMFSSTNVLTGAVALR